MASAAQGGASNDNENDLACVYRAVDQGASADQVRAILASRSRTLTAVLEYKGGANSDETPLQAAHRRRDGPPLVGALLEHGAGALALGAFANPLAICIAYGLTDSLRVLLRRGKHSLDEKRYHRLGITVAPWRQRAIEELLSSRVHVHPRHTQLALPFAARLAERLDSQVARRNRSGAMQWRAHEDMVGLAFDFQEMREADEAVARREAQVKELEEELRALGCGTEDADDEKDEGKRSGDDEAAGGSAGGDEPPAAAAAGE
jgi:hypothetical protein